MNKRKVLSILLLALITVTLAISCSGSIDAPAQDAEELAYVTFGNGHSRELSTSYETLPYNSLYWFYTAQKTDSYGTTGQVGLDSDRKPTEAVSKNGEDPARGLSGRVGPFSQGAWDFTLYAYKEAERITLVYQSEAVHVILKGNEVKNVPVSVSTQGDYGYVKFKNAYFRWLESTDTPAGQGGGEAAPQMEITLTKTGTTITNDIVLNYVQVEGANRFNVQDGLSIITSATENPDRIPEGFYTAKVIVYLKQAASGNNVAIDNKGTPIFSQEFGLRVYGNATTYISGDMVEGVDSYVTFDVADQQMVVFSPNPDGSASFNVAVSPKGTTTGSSTDTKTTQVVFPAGALVGAEHQLDVAVTPIASAEQKFQVSGEANNETAVAGIDLTMVKVEEQSGSLTQTPVKTFNGKSVTVTTYIATGLSNVSVKYLNNGVPSDEGISEIEYKPNSGLLTFKTTHFSQYVVIAPVEALNVSTGVPYTSLADAIAAAGDGQEIQLKKAVNVTSAISVNKNLTLDLNGNNITGTSTRIFNVKAGTLELGGTGNITSNGPNTDKFSNGSSVIRVGDNGSSNPKVKAGLIVGRNVRINGPASYGVTVFGSKTQETVEINGTITSYSGAVSGNGTDSYWGTTIVINDGANLSATNGPAVYHPQDGMLVINGGIITGNTGVEVKGGTVIIEGGVFASNYSGDLVVDKAPDDDGGNSLGYALSVVEKKGYAGNADVTINGGTFNSHIVKGVSPNKPNPVKENSLSIYGGTFSSDPTAYVASLHTATRNGDGTWTVQRVPEVKIGDTYYAGLPEAISAAQSGDTIELGEGVFYSTGKNTSANTSGNKIARDITIVGSGHEKTVIRVGSADFKTGEYGGDYAFDGEGTITFRNLTLKDNYSDNANCRGYIRPSNMVLENCRIESMFSYWGSGSVTFNRCTFDTPEYNMWLYSGNSFNFNNCTFNSEKGKFINAYVESQMNDETYVINITNSSFIVGNSADKYYPAVCLKKQGNAAGAYQGWILNIKNSTINSNGKQIKYSTSTTELKAEGNTGLYAVEINKETNKYVPGIYKVTIDGSIVLDINSNPSLVQ